MQLTEQNIREFQDLWEQHSGEKISAQEAEEQARSLILFFQTIFQK